MSLPVSACMMIRACKNEEAYQGLLKRMRYNIKHGAFTVYDCKCDPPCTPPTDAEAKQLEDRLTNDLKSDANPPGY